MSFDPNKPQMADHEVEIIDELIEQRQPRRCLEWGSGGSTNYFPREHECIRYWLSIEHDPEWYAKIKDLVPEKVDLELLDKDNYYADIWKRHRNYPRIYDFILVDGIFRRECLIIARGLLAVGGIVLLHDSGRGEYTPSYGLYPYQEKLCDGEIPRKDGKTYKHRGLMLFTKWGIDE